MTEVTISEAQQHLPELLAAAEDGETVTIRSERGRIFHITAQAPVPVVNPGWKGYPHAGSAKGLIQIGDGFDDLLEELKEYME